MTTKHTLKTDIGEFVIASPGTRCMLLAKDKIFLEERIFKGVYIFCDLTEKHKIWIISDVIAREVFLLDGTKIYQEVGWLGRNQLSDNILPGLTKWANENEDILKQSDKELREFTNNLPTTQDLPATTL